VGEPTVEAAARELCEETGYRSHNVEFLVSIYTTVCIRYIRKTNCL